MNIINYPYAAIHKLNTSVSADEVFGLYGAQAKTGMNNYMLRLGGYMDSLWEFYLKYLKNWKMISAFFAAFCRGSSEVRASSFSVPQTASWKSYRRALSSDVYFRTGMDEIFDQLSLAGVIRNHDFSETEAYGNLSFEYPDTNERESNSFFSKLDKLLSNPGNLKLSYTITANDNGSFDISIASGVQVSYYFQTNTFTSKDGTSFLVKDMQGPLEDLEKRGLISSLNFNPTAGSRKVDFVYSNRAIRDCLITAGNILEARVWHEAEKAGYFDSLQANFSFSWPDSRISNELDVILTKGLTTLVISCKTAKFNKEHLYEIADLSRRFSVNSIPVIIYS